MLSPIETKALNQAAAAVGTRPEWLYDLIMFESGWDPAARNRASGARGLIQFTNTTARNMGYTGADEIVEKYPTRAEQLFFPVLTYLIRSGPPFDTKQKLFMAVFYPVYKNVDENTPFPAEISAGNSGIISPADYIARVDARANRGAALAEMINGAAPFSVILLLAAGFILYSLLTAKK